MAVEDNSRMSLRIRREEKSLLMRAVALEHTDLTDFVIRHAVQAAKAIVEEADHVKLSERDSQRVLALLENPPRAKRKTAGSRPSVAQAEIVIAWHEEPVHKKHDREGFDCGEEPLNEFLRRYARKSHERGGLKNLSCD
ncbi:MAG TPA: DUF1778 domain-containing protein [Candidatus Acidoferrum sp.]|nr:DUF1778 domain-containing protein [Candidatus Acidoferrum sp.]